MFENYKAIHHPRSIEDVVDKGIIQNLMQAFFYREGTGIALLYNREGAQPDAHGLVLQRLHPFSDEHSTAAQAAAVRDGYSAFCRTLRKNEELDLTCMQCDEQHASKAIQVNSGEPQRYCCHMGLDDMHYPIKVGQRVRAVLFAGQRLPRWNHERMTHVGAEVAKKVRSESLRAGLAPFLAPLADEEKTAIIREADNLWEAFKAFGKTVQTTVNSFYEAKLTLAHQQAQLEVNSKINASLMDTAASVSQTITAILEELTRLPSMSALVLMMRRASRYVTVAASSQARKAMELHIPVHEIIPFSAESWRVLDDEDISPRLRDVRERFFRSNPLNLYRIDAANQDARALSVLLIVQGHIGNEQKKLLSDCMRSMASTTHVHALIEQMQQQQDSLATTVTFTGHSMKTPISGALLSLDRIDRYSKGAELTRAEIGQVAERIGERLQEVLLDAWQFQAAIKAKPIQCDLVEIMETVLKSLDESAVKLNVLCVLHNELKTNPKVLAIETRLRVALRNLLDNAIKYSFSGREVRIYLRWLAQRELIITISNYGVGIDPTKLGELFTLGARVQLKDSLRRRGGAGLGLVQAKTYIEDCGGSLDLESKKLPDDNLRSPRSLITATITLPTQI